MKNETFKEHAEQMQQHMASMMEDFGAMVGTVKNLNEPGKK